MTFGRISRCNWIWQTMGAIFIWYCDASFMNWLCSQGGTEGPFLLELKTDQAFWNLRKVLHQPCSPASLTMKFPILSSRKSNPDKPLAFLTQLPAKPNTYYSPGWKPSPLWGHQLALMVSGTLPASENRLLLGTLWSSSSLTERVF